MPLLRRNPRAAPNGLQTRGEIALFKELQEALRSQAEREEADQRVRKAKLQNAGVTLFLIGTVPIGIALCIGALGDPEGVKLAVAAAGAWTSLALALTRWWGRGGGQ